MTAILPDLPLPAPQALTTDDLLLQDAGTEHDEA